jgi:hypothetical protein
VLPDHLRRNGDRNDRRGGHRESLLSHLDRLFACGFGEDENKKRKEK